MPTGLTFAGFSRDFAPMNGSNTCLGRMLPPLPVKASAQNGVGLGYITRTVRESTFSTLMSRNAATVTADVAGSPA